MDVGVPVDVGVLKDEITSYPMVMCQVELVNGWCPRGQGLPLNWNSTNKLYQDQQMVVSTSRGGLVDRLTNCAVGDRRNWKCTFDDRSGSIGLESMQPLRGRLPGLNRCGGRAPGLLDRTASDSFPCTGEAGNPNDCRGNWRSGLQRGYYCS